LGLYVHAAVPPGADCSDCLVV